jgi:cell division protease FtsH
MQDNSGKNGNEQKSWLDRVWNRNGGDGKEGKDGEPGSSRPRVPSWLIGLLILALVAWYLYQNFVPRNDSSSTAVPYSVVTAQIDSGNVKEATITDSSIRIELENPVYWNKTDQVVEETSSSSNVETDELRATIPPVVQTNNQQLIDQLTAQNVVVKGEQRSSSLWTGLLVSFLPILLFLGLILFMGRQMTRGQQNVFGFGASSGDVCGCRR